MSAAATKSLANPPASVVSYIIDVSAIKFMTDTPRTSRGAFVMPQAQRSGTSGNNQSFFPYASKFFDRCDDPTRKE